MATIKVSNMTKPLAFMRTTPTAKNRFHRLPLLWFALALGLLPAASLAQTPLTTVKPEAGSAEEPLAVEAQWKNTPDLKLPNVLILGDSISIGYTLQVRDRLKGVANVYRPMMTKAGRTLPGNCMDSATGLKKLKYWLGTNSWQVIHFNFGLHDLKYLDKDGKYVKASEGTQLASPEVYEKNLRELVARLKQTGAVLIWASTTPVPANTLGRVEGDERIYNQLAEKVMREYNIQLDDLWGAVAPRFKELGIKPGNVHFNDEGYQILASAVAEAVKSALKQPK
jgi:acyl-CoA thioesterase-1